MHTTETASTKEATGIMVKNLDSTYDKADLEQVSANAVYMNPEERTKLLVQLKKIEGLFDVTLGKCNTEPIYLELNADSKLFNGKY